MLMMQIKEKNIKMRRKTLLRYIHSFKKHTKENKIKNYKRLKKNMCFEQRRKSYNRKCTGGKTETLESTVDVVSEKCLNNNIV